MRIYEGSPRQDFEEVFRSIGAFLDQRGMREILLVEAPDGFIVQGLGRAGGAGGHLVGVDGLAVEGDPDLPRRRHRPVHGGSRRPARQAGPRAATATPASTRRRSGSSATTSTSRSRVTSSSSSRTARSWSACSLGGQAGSRHALAEFTRDDIAQLVPQARRCGCRSSKPRPRTATGCTEPSAARPGHARRRSRP